VGISQALGSVPSARGADRLTRAAFDELVEQYQRPLLRFLYGLVHDPELAADLCQDTFLSAYKARTTLKGELNAGAWLYTIALNHARGYLRRKKLLSWVPFIPGRDEKPAPTGDMATRAAQSDEVQELLAALPYQQRACLLLHADGFRYSEIAQILNCSEGAVKLRIFRARACCLKHVAGEKEEDA
jgi:RNA polymerase sigma-70 factor (ECF subfamily)